VSLLNAVRIGQARRRQRRAVALAAILAILVQAVLFAWHHHPSPFHLRAAAAVTILAVPISPAVPAVEDHDCQICFTLSHHGAVPVNFFAPSPPGLAPSHHTRLAALDAPRAPYFFFQSRAPPAA
jgi:hypothetical protein